MATELPSQIQTIISENEIVVFGKTESHDSELVSIRQVIFVWVSSSRDISLSSSTRLSLCQIALSEIIRP